MSEMTEAQFREKLFRILEREFPEYKVEKGKSILYKMIVDAEGRLQPSNYASPKRGQLAFQTDVLIGNDKVPLVVIETKIRGFSTHDVLIYSTKAVKHKEVYPHLRYGFIVGQSSKIDRKFFIHNSGFDFAIAVRNLDHESNSVVEVVRKQTRSAELMLDVLKDKKVRRYVTNLELEWATEQ